METTASLIAIVTLCEQVIKYINATVGAKDDRQRLRLQIRTCTNFIHELKDQAEDSEQTEEWAKLMQLLSGPLARLHEALSLAAQSLSSRDSTVEKLKWPLKEKDVRKLVEAVKCETDLLSLAFDRNTTRLLHQITLQTQHNEQLLTELKTSLVVRDIDQKCELTRIEKHFKRVQISQHGVQERVQLLHERYDLEEASEKRQSILEWLTPIDHASHQRDAIRRRQPGTGLWFLDSPQYQDWVSGKNRTLFCPGIPGAGKTVLASIINDDLWKRYHADSRVGLAHLFFDYRRQDQQSSEALLSGLLKQLVEKQASLPKSVEDFYEMQHQRASDRTRATLDILDTVIADFSRVFIVLDAIDECISPGEIRTELLCAVQQLQGKCGLNLLATSRDVPEITERFAAASVLQIRAHAEDVQRYLYGQVQRLPSFVHRSISLQEEVVSSIVKAVQGMFLLAKLHIDSLVGKRSPKALRASLNNLATGSQAYDAAYEAAMLRIKSQPGDLKELAIQTLTFLTCTKHRFSEVDLQTVLATEFGESYIDPENFPDIDDVLTACVGLVTIDNEGAVIRLTHYTTQEYLKRTQQRWFPDAQAIITDTCLSFLLSEYEKPDVLELWSHESWYKYSAINWGHHAREAPSVHLRMMELLSQSAVVQNDLVSLRDQSIVFYEYFWKRPISRILLSGLHLAVYFGLESATVLLLDEETGHSLELAERDVNRQMALFIAIEQGHEAIVKQLLLRGTPIHPLVDTSLLDREDIALHLAMSNGHHHILKLLLDEGCSVNLRDMTGCTALHRAVEGQHIPSVKVLLEAHADVDAQDVDLITPLHIAAEYPDSTILKMLLEHGAKVNMADCAGQTALQVAVYQGLFSSAKLLLDYKADVNTASQKFDTPLHKAAISGDSRTLSLLLDYGGAVELRNHDGNIALHHAVLSKDTPSVRILLEHKSDVNAANLERETPLNYATRIKDPTILGLLLEFGAAVDMLDPDGNTALMNACFWLTKPQAHVDLLIAAGANICVLNNMNCSTLIWAMKHGPRPALLRFLLGHGADPNLGLPSLSYAELQLEELVSHNALFGLSPDQCVEKQNWEECIQVLEEAGAHRDPEFSQKWKVRF